MILATSSNKGLRQPAESNIRSWTKANKYSMKSIRTKPDKFSANNKNNNGSLTATLPICFKSTRSHIFHSLQSIPIAAKPTSLKFFYFTSNRKLWVDEKNKKWMLNRKSAQNDCKWCAQVVDITTKALDRDSIQFWTKFWATYISIVLMHTHPCTALPSWIAKCECGLRGGWRETWKSSARPRVTFRI